MDIYAICGGFHWRLSRPYDLETLWNSMEGNGSRIPYWTELWPSSLVLADFLQNRREEISGQLCCDIGCGLGLTALLGQKLDANIIALDIEREALVWCIRNGRLNDAGQPGFVCMDLERPAIRPGSIQRAWAGDMIYERIMFQPMLSLLEEILVPGGKAWLAEPGRTIFYDFLRDAKKRGWKMETAFVGEAPAFYLTEPSKTVRVWQFWKD